MHTYQTFSHKTKASFLFKSLLLILIVFALLSITTGSVTLQLQDVLTTLQVPLDVTNPTSVIIYNIRIPRLLGAIFAGAALSVAGLLLQTLLNNPLASPSIIGLNSGAALGAVLMFTFFPYAYEYIPLLATSFGFLTTLLVFFISRAAGGSRLSIILAGIALSNIISAILDLISIFLPESKLSATSFLIGNLAGITPDQLKFPIIYIILGLLAAFFLTPRLNILTLGDETAHSLGLNLKHTRLLLIAIATILAGSAISYCGLLSFIGLLIPHVIRLIVGTDHTLTLVLSALAGSTFLVVCDLLVRLLFAPYEVPVGILLAFLGGPFFIYLLISSRKTASLS